MSKKKKRPQRRMLSPVWLDKDDQKSVENLREFLWARTYQDAFLQSLRWACGVAVRSPAKAKKFKRESDRAFADGRPLILRLTEEQREHLEEFAEAIKADTTTDAVRIVLRMSEDRWIREVS